jgi:hypothetical protein
MTERPILFSGQMVRAILGGAKTQTRRVLHAAEGTFWGHPGYELRAQGDGMWGWHWRETGEAANPSTRVRCPYGVPGDRLWVRETFRQAPGSMSVHYAADRDEVSGGPWRPSIFMPRWASRLTLELTSVRVERLQDISEADAEAEGIAELVPPDNRGQGLTDGALAMAAAATVAAMARPTRRAFLGSALAASLGFIAGARPWEVGSGALRRGPSPEELFHLVWDSINGKRAPWDSNPWVWVVAFRTTGEGEAQR